jgi:hypothetical protein
MTLPDIVVQEIRNTLALHCRDIVMANKADGEKSDKQALLVGKCFHGTESHASVLKLSVCFFSYCSVFFQVIKCQSSTQILQCTQKKNTKWRSFLSHCVSSSPPPEFICRFNFS